jgi:hypothetical protein
MALPDSRDITLGGGSKIPSSLLNALQDQVIGSKHPEQPVIYGPGSFLLEAAGATLSGNEYWEGSGAFTIRRNLLRPVGTVITEITYVYNRNNVGTLTLRFQKANLITGGVHTDIVAASSIAAGTGIATTTITPNYTMEADHSIVLRLTGSNATNRIYGARVKFRRG